MPIHSCTLKNGGKGIKWGSQGICYPDTVEGKKKLLKQAAAIESSMNEEDDHEDMEDSQPTNLITDGIDLDEPKQR